jgi:SAM-dependent methyltransferase
MRLREEMPVLPLRGQPLFSDTPLFAEEPVRAVGPYGDRPLSEDLFTVRKRLAHRYLHGRGVEFGALHSPLDVPLHVDVRYADMMTGEELQNSFPHITNIRTPDIVTDLESMSGIDDESEDFVIGNHVMEHVEDPFRALKSINRVLRPDGIAFIALPDKRFTFDRNRAATSLEHLIKDHDQGPDCSLAAHYDEWCRCVDGLNGEAHRVKVEQMLAQRANIHFHVWDYPAMMEMFSHVVRLHDLRLEILLSMLNAVEVIWIMRKTV